MSLSHRPHSQRTERDETNTSILKNKKLGADAVQLKKNALTQEFKELYRERNVRVAEERSDIPKPKEHKLRQALDGLLGENKRRDNRLNELKLRLNIMRRDDISGIEPSEKSVEQRFNRSVGSDSARKMSRYEPGSESKMKDGKDLVDRFAYVKQTLDNILNRKEDEEEINKMLETKINELLRDQKVLADRIGKKGALYEMMEKRFLNLGNTEFAAKNKLTRTSNKLLSLKKEMEKQKTHEDDYFNMKRTAFKRTLSTVEGLKDTIARNLIYLEEIHLKKDEVDEKLEEVNYEEKQIINKRQASEYILLYIDLLESLENDYLKKKETPKALIKKQSKGPKLNYDSSPKDKPKSMISSGTEETPRKLSEPSRPGSQTMDLEKKGQNSSDTTRDRDVIITRIAQFYDQHPSGTHALVQTLLKIYHEMLLNEQSLSIRHQDLNIERLERQAEIEELEKGLSALQQGFILMEEKDEDAEEASPEHVRETERKVVGKLGQYDYKTVKLGEYLVNLCATGIQDTISKLSKAGCSLVTKSGKRVSGELAGRVKEIEGSLSYPKSDFSVPELQGRARSISKAEDSGRDTSISVRPRTISLSTSSPKESVINLQNLQKPEQTDERKDTSSRSEEAGKILFSQQTISGGGSEEFNKVEQLFRSCVPGASPELVYKWNEKVFESKWMLDYLTKEDVKRVVNKYTYYYGNDISEELLKSVLRDLKNEARLVQRKRTSEAFNMTEELLSIFLKHYQAKKNDLRKRFDTEIRSEVLDDLNQVLAVSEHVEKAHNARYQNLFSEQQTEETDVWRKVEDPHDSESEMELVSLRAKTPEIKNMKTTREAIAELHNHYLKERRGLASSQGRRSNSAPKFKVVVSRTRKESFESSDNEEMDSQKGSRLQVGKNGSVNDEKDMVIDSSMTRKKDSSSARRNSRASTEMAGEVTEEDRDGVKKSLVKRVDHLVPIAKEKKVYPIPQAFYKAQQKQKNVEEFKKKLIKDDEILRKIALLEKRQTGFDKKSKDYDKRRDYVPNFSLLEKFDLNREKKRDQIVQEWWKRQEAGMLDTTNRDRSSTPFLISSSRKDERQSWQLDQHTDSSRNVIVSQKRRSLSKSNVKPWTLPEEPIAHTSRPGTGSQGRRSSGRRSSGLKRDSFDDLENKLFKEAISQNRAGVTSEIEKL